MTRVAIPADALDKFRAAASQFAPVAASNASRLLSVKDDIAALRKKGASYRTISELLTHCGIGASDTCVMRFCQRQLGHKRDCNGKRKPSANPISAPNTTPAAASGATTAASPHATPCASPGSTALNDLLTKPRKTIDPLNDDGPRIARIEFAKPEDL